MLKFYLDEDVMAVGLVSALRSQGFDIVTVADAGLLGASDEAQLAFALRSERVLYSFNAADFCRIHFDWSAADRSHAGIIIGIQRKYPVGEQMRRLSRINAVNGAARMRNRIEYLSNWG